MPSLVLCVFKVIPFLIGVGKSVKAGTTLKPSTKGEILTITEDKLCKYNLVKLCLVKVKLI